MRHNISVALAAGALAGWAATAAAQAPSPSSPREGGSGSTSERQREGIGPVDKQREGLGPEGTDLGSPSTSVKPMTAPAVRETARYAPAEILAGAHRTSALAAQAAQLAQQRAKNPGVKRLAADMVRGQQAAAGRIMGYTRAHETPADAEAVGPFAQPVATLEQQVRELKSARGTVFDTRFAQMAVQAQQQTLESIGTASESVREPELKQVLETWRATVQKDLDAARTLTEDVAPVPRTLRSH